MTKTRIASTAPGNGNLRERANATKEKVKRAARGNFSDQPSPESLPGGSAVEGASIGFSSQAQSAQSAAEGLRQDREGAADRRQPSGETDMGRHESFENATPIEGVYKPLSLLATPESSADFPHDLADACDWAVGHVDWLNAAARSEGWDDDRITAEVDKADAIWERACREAASDARTLAAKARMLRHDWRGAEANAEHSGDGRDRLTLRILSDLTALTITSAVIDPIFAVIEEARRLWQVHDALFKAREDGPSSEEEDDAYNAMWACVDGRLLQTVPQTAEGCRALAGFAVEFMAAQGVSLGEASGEREPILALIARSPLVDRTYALGHESGHPTAPVGIELASAVRDYFGSEPAAILDGDLRLWTLANNLLGAAGADKNPTSLLHEPAPAAGIQIPNGSDPALLAIATSRWAETEMASWQSEMSGRHLTDADFAEEERLERIQRVSRDKALSTIPTTQAGRVALAEYARFQLTLHGYADGDGPVAEDHIWHQTHEALMAALAAPVTALAEPDLSQIPTQHLSTLHELIKGVWLHITAELQAPWCWDGDSNNAAGNFLDAEGERMVGLLDVVMVEAGRRVPADQEEQEELLGLRLRHALAGGGAIDDRKLMADVVKAWGA